MIIEPEQKSFISEQTHPNFFSPDPYNALVAIVCAVLGCSIYNYQAEILQAVMYYPRVAVVASRQIGKSVCIALLALAWAISKPNQTILIISTGERQVKELLTKRHFSIKKIYKRSGRDSNIVSPASDLYLPYEDELNVDPKSMIKAVGAITGMDINFAPKYDQPELKLDFGISHENAEEIEFKNGSRIVVVPANPDTASGYTANLLIGDEIAKMPGWTEMQAACFPMVSRVGGHIALYSSFKGRNHWHAITEDKLSPENPKGWKVLKYPVTVNPPPELAQLQHDLDEATFMEEYMCVPMDETHSMFPYKLIEAVSTGFYGEWY